MGFQSPGSAWGHSLKTECPGTSWCQLHKIKKRVQKHRLSLPDLRVHKTAAPERRHGGTLWEEEGPGLSCGIRGHVLHREMFCCLKVTEKRWMWPNVEVINLEGEGAAEEWAFVLHTQRNFSVSQRGSTRPQRSLNPLTISPLLPVCLSPLISYSQAGGDQFTTHLVEFQDISSIFKLTNTSIFFFIFQFFPLLFNWS